MKRLLILSLIAPIAALAGASFEGTWKTDLSTFKISGKPDVYDLSNGLYSCRSCSPAYTVKADGTDQAVTGHSYADHVAVKVMDASTVEIVARKDGKVMNEVTLTVAADSASYTAKYTNYTGAQSFSGTYTEKRVAPAPAGSHAISGSWMQQSVTDASDVGQLLSLHETDHGIQIEYNGQKVDAKFDGKRYAWSNDPGKTESSFRKISATQFQEYDHRLGKLTDVTIFTLSPDGRTMTQVDYDKQQGSKSSLRFNKQP